MMVYLHLNESLTDMWLSGGAEACSEVWTSCNCAYNCWPFHIPADHTFQVCKVFKAQ